MNNTIAAIVFICFFGFTIAHAQQIVPGKQSEKWPDKHCYIDVPNVRYEKRIRREAAYRYNLTKMLGGGVDKQCLRISPWPENIIKNKKGCYYKVTLRGLDLSRSYRYKPILFSCGQHTIDKFSTRFRESLMTLSRLLQPLDDYKIYIRGMADAGGSCSIDQISSHNPIHLNYIPRVSDFAEIHQGHASVSIDNPVTNDELPLLRAAFLKNSISIRSYAINGMPELLESKVSENNNSSDDRQAQIYLFLECKQ